MKRPTCLAICLLLAFMMPCVLSAQLDSLEQALTANLTTSERLSTMNYLVEYSIRVDPEKGFRYADEALELAAAKGSPEERYHSHFRFSRLSAFSSMRIDEGLLHTKKALEICEKELNDPEKTLHTQIMLGAFYDLHDEPDKAIQIYGEAINTAKEQEDHYSAFSCLTNTARIYRFRGDDVNAERYYLKALEEYEDKLDSTNIAQLYTYLGAVAVDVEQGLRYLKNAREIYIRVDAKDIDLANNADDIAIKYYEIDEYDEAEKWFQSALDGSAGYADSTQFYGALRGLGLVWWEQGQRAKGVEAIESVHAYFSRQPGVGNQMKIIEVLEQLYAGLGKYEDAYELAKNTISLKDSIYNEQIANALTESNVRFATAEKETLIANQELEITRQETARIRLLAGGLVVLAVLAGIFQYLFYRQRRRKAVVDLALAEEARETTRLRELDTMKTQFFTNVSHELRTPLTLITSPLEEALGKLKQTNLKPNLELAHRNSHQLLGLVNEMLDLAKLETGNVSSETSTQNFEPWLRRVFFSFQSAAEGKNLNWDYNFSPSAVTTVETDFPKLEKMVNNLLSNALKFTPAGGRVALSGSCIEDKLILVVTDDGPGIPSEELPRIFERFYQSSHLPATGGTGIGLALSRRLARLLNGDLTATSELEKGSRFELSLPVITSMASIVHEEEEIMAETTVASPAATLSLSGDRPRLLIVEDHPEMSLYLRQSLVQDYDSVLAENGAKALELMAGQSFDLILSDVMMPVMDGFALRQKINETPEWAGTPFIFLTARTLEADKLHGFKLGVDDYVTKPFQLAELKARMQSLLRNKTRREEHALSAETEMDNEQQLLDRAEGLVRERLDDLTFTVEELAKELGYSQRQLSRVFGRLAGLTPVQFVLEVRLQHARHLLETGQHGTVAEVRYAIGIESASYFTRKFKERFGRSPKTYLEET